MSSTLWGFLTVDACAASYTPIYNIQGSGLSSPMAGTVVSTRGVVVGDFEGTTGQQGFYLQDLTGDGDPATSDGIFVFTGSSNLVSAGQVVRVTGTVRERFDQTSITGGTATTPVPAAAFTSCSRQQVTHRCDHAVFGADYPRSYERHARSRAAGIWSFLNTSTLNASAKWSSLCLCLANPVHSLAQPLRAGSPGSCP